MDKKLINFSQAENKVRAEILSLLKKALAKDFSAELFEIEYPPESKLGDFTVACFQIAKKIKKSPAEVAVNLAKEINTGLNPNGLILNSKNTGPYLNFFVDQTKFSELVLTEIIKSKDKYGEAKIGKGQKIMVEYFSPNTNKPLTIGHVRNICLGQSLSQLFNSLGYKVIDATLYNDRGIAIAKAIVGYQKWSNGQTPKSTKTKPDHFVGSFYVKFCQEAKNNPDLEKQAKQVLQDWEKGEKKVKADWQKLMGWVLAGFDQTLAKLGAESFEEKYYESEYYNEGKEVVEMGLKKGVFTKDKEGVTLAPLEKFNLPDKILLRPDGTSLYMTQDIYLAYLKDKHDLTESIYVVGSEQDLYFKQLFKILELLNFKNKNYYHLSYGMIRLASGKIKSREGLIQGTGADELMAQLKVLAMAEISQRDKILKPKELDKRAEQIALGALKFYILSVGPKTTMVFEPEKSIAFTGKTGPYLQYVQARINSIFTKGKIKVSAKVDFSRLNNQLEFELVKLLAKFPLIINQSAINRDPSQLANYLYELAKAFSLFYEKVPVLKTEPKIKKARLLLINNVKIVLVNGLDLLGIEAPDKM